MNTDSKPQDQCEGARRELAATLDCFTEKQLQTLGALKRNTLGAWRKRGTGPEYIRFGNEFFYPRESVKKHLLSKVRTRSQSPAGSL